MRGLVGWGLGLTTLGITAGCLGPEVVVAAGLTVAEVGTAAYVGGQLVSAYESPLLRVSDATRVALAGLEFAPSLERPGEASMYFLVKDMNGREIGVRLESASPAVTRIKIRVGVWGDQAVSQVIMRRIEREMGLLKESGL